MSLLDWHVKRENLLSTIFVNLLKRGMYMGNRDIRLCKLVMISVLTCI